MVGAAGVYTGGGATVVMDPPPVVYVEVFGSGSGPERHLRQKANAVGLTARVLAPRRSGALAAGIRVGQNRNERGQYAFGFSVSSSVYYSHYVHEGTGPSVRISATEDSYMRFPGTGRYFGQQVFTQVVHHPGTPAQPFLRDALAAMAG